MNERVVVKGDGKYHKYEIAGIYYAKCGGRAHETISKAEAEKRELDECEECYQ